jgi:predicted ATPase/DNA-binding SARP family transcriptional activator
VKTSCLRYNDQHEPGEKSRNSIALDGKLAIMLRIHLFGALRLFDNEQPLKFSSLPKTLPLWAYLLLNPAPSTPRDQLAYTLWPDVSEAEARGNLRRHLHDLRRALPTAPQECPWLLADTNTVQWNPEADDWLDIESFAQLSADPTRLAEAVTLYTGDLLPNVYEDWVIFHRERLRNRFFDCLLQLVQQTRGQGNYPQAIAYAQQILQHDPIREDVVRELMTLRHEGGDRAGALQEYQRFAQRLREELDVAPMLETSALYDAIARQTLAVAARHERKTPAMPPVAPTAAPATPTPAPPAPAGPPNNLPAQLTTFIGREAELAAVYQLLLAPGSSVRLLTLTGPGGGGKTRLALEVGLRLCQDQPGLFPAGIHMVWLATLNDPELVLPTIANTLNVSESVGKTLLESLQDYLHTRRLLLILDNFEHQASTAPPLVQLLSAAPELRIIVTSRALLQVYGEQEFSLPPLPLPDEPDQLRVEDATRYAAIALFIARSRAVNPAFTLNPQNVTAVAAICTRLDGLPLAIELAAARSKLLSPPAILARLDSALTFLTDRGTFKARSQLDRHQTLRATLDWSYNLLAAREQQLFARLAVFAGNFTLEQAEAVCDLDKDGDTLDLLETLVNNSLLRQHEDEGVIYFRLLTTIREYALARLAASAEAETMHSRHAVCFLALAQEVAPKLHNPEQVAWLHKLENAHTNLRAALTWAVEHNQAEIALALATALYYFWSKSGHLPEGRQWFARVLALPAAQSPTVTRAAALNAAGWLELNYTDVDYTLPTAFYQESLTISKQISNPSTLAYAYLGLARTLDFSDIPRAQELLERSLHLFEQVNDRWGTASALSALARTFSHRGEVAHARALIDQSVAIFQELGDRWSVGYTLVIQAFVLHFTQHDYTTARTLYREALPIGNEAEDKSIVATALVNLADLALVEGAYDQAEFPARQALPMFQELGELWQPPRLLRMLSIIAAQRGDEAQAIALTRESIQLNRRLGDTRAVIAGLIALAYNAHCQGQHEKAARQLAAADTAIEQHHAQLLPADVAIQQRTLAVTRAALSPAEFAACWVAGQGITLDDAIEL